MKTITFNIPTSFKEFRSMLKERTSKRYRHNVEVLLQLQKDIATEVNSNYWSNDISDTMKNRVFGRFGKMNEYYTKAKNNLK